MQFDLYFTLGCHLCELAEQEIETFNQFKPHMAVKYFKVDIATDDQLMDLYAAHIPVLKHLDSDTCLYWPFSAQDIQEFVTKV